MRLAELRRVSCLAALAAMISVLGPSYPQGASPPGDVSLFPNQVTVVSGQAWSMATADFNRDRQPDLAVASNSYRGEIEILLGKADGTFRKSLPIVIASEVDWVSALDLNQDHLPDALVTSDYQVQFFPGGGNGTFSPPVTIISGETPLGPPAILDLDADSRPDIVVPDFKTNLVRVFLARKGGAFSATSTSISVDSPESVAGGDFDGNGTVDIAAFSRQSCDISLLSGHGDGSFYAGRHIPSGVYLQNCFHSRHFLASADFNFDHYDDLAISSQSDGQILVLLADGGGQFKPPAKYPTSGSPSPIWIGDVDRNGSLDLAVADYSQDEVAILLGRRDGTFASPKRVPVGRGPTSVLFADLNRDRVHDLVAAFRTYSRSVHVFLGNGDGSWGPPTYPVPAREFSSLALGDFDGDARLDAAVTVSRAQEAYVFPGRGDGSFEPALSHKVGWNPMALASGDFDEDGRADLAVAARDFNPRRDGPIYCGLGPGRERPDPPHGFVVVLHQSADHAMQIGDRIPVGWNPTHLRTGDLNGDGNLDLVALNRGERDLDQPPGLSVLLGNGDATFAPEISVDLEPNPLDAVLADFDSDGRLDLALLTGGRPPILTIRAGQGDGRFGAGRAINVETTGSGLAAGDFDSDGHPDLFLAAMVDAQPYQSSSSAVILLGKGDGTFTPIRSAPGIPPGRPMTADFDGDGHPDLAVLGESGEISILIGSDLSGFSPEGRYSPVGRATLLSLGDLNGDGHPDLVTDVPGGISVLLNRKAGRPNGAVVR